MKTLKEINAYIKENKAGIDPRFRQRYHMMPPIGWMNDPNGLSVFNGKYHLFYQYNPFDVKPGVTLWGQFTSEDLIKYVDEDVAIVPDAKYDSIFSGGAIGTDDGLCAVFTLHHESDLVKKEEIFVAYSDDGVTFGEKIKAFDNEDLPEYISRADFRDPYPVKRKGEYFVFLGGKDKRSNSGVIVVLGGKDLSRLEYRFTIGPFYELGDMGECPSLCRVGDKDVFVVSGCNVKERGNDFKNVNSSVFIVGNVDFKKGEMTVDLIKEIDKGDCFYAPQFVNGSERPLMIGWQEMWGKSYPTQNDRDGWVGAFTIPREISLREGDVFQAPVRELDKYCSPYAGDGVPRCARLKLRLTGDGKVAFKGKDGEFSVGSASGKIYLDTTLSNNMNGCVRKTDGRYTDCEVLVLIDVSGVEIFVDGGRETVSSRIYIDGGLSLETVGKAEISAVERVDV